MTTMLIQTNRHEQMIYNNMQVNGTTPGLTRILFRQFLFGGKYAQSTIQTVLIESNMKSW